MNNILIKCQRLPEIIRNLFMTVSLFLLACGILSCASLLEPHDQPPSGINGQAISADISAPRILDISVSVSDNNSIVVRWHTDEEATGETVLYDVVSETEALGNRAEQFTFDHELALDGNLLKAGITYSLTVISRDRAGNMASHHNARMLSVNTLAKQNAAYRVFSLELLEGGQVNLSNFAGRQVLLHFWMPGCHVCEDEIALIESAYASSDQNELPILTISVRADKDVVSAYIKSKGFKFPVLLDLEGTVSSAYGVATFPSTYLVDSEGTIIKSKEGRFGSLDEIYGFMGLKSHINGL